MITIPILQSITKLAPLSTLEKVVPELNDTMEEYGIDTPLRQAHFLAQILHESGSFLYSEEIASGAAYEGRTDLGNTHPGDGKKFKGRGYIQLTGRANYIAYGKYLGVDLLTDPTIVANKYACDVAGWFWEVKNLNELADLDRLIAITQRINGGQNGIDERRMYLIKAKEALGV